MPKVKETTKKSSPKAKKASERKDMKDSPLHEFFMDGLKDMYYAENALVEALKKMEKAATSKELKKAFKDHKSQTEKHYAQLEKVFKELGEKPEEKECKAMDGLIEEAEEIISDTEEGTMTRDAALIIAAQKVEHYEIASYGGLAQLANTMEHSKAADLLGEILEQEKEADELLTEIAKNSINYEAEEEE
ncbi:MAG: ferritin-like domain-containing protein [Flavobacteriaceae bacterium]|jgi:ferritin-like metal-binding protein YciE|nr:ferritin-like domain-containing protein [Flavobacteriaceae bacterium]